MNFNKMDNLKQHNITNTKQEEDMKEIKHKKEILERGIKFANLNKNNNLEDYEKEVFEKGDYSIETVKVVKEIELSEAEYREVTKSLLTDRLDMWEKIGGRTLTEEAIAEAEKLGFDFDDPKWWNKDIKHPQMQFFFKNSVVEVVKVTCEGYGRPFYVNTEGYGYARYVGL